MVAIRRVKQIVEDPESVGIVAETVPGGAVTDEAPAAEMDDASLS